MANVKPIIYDGKRHTEISDSDNLSVKQAILVNEKKVIKHEDYGLFTRIQAGKTRITSNKQFSDMVTGERLFVVDQTATFLPMSAESYLIKLSARDIEYGGAFLLINYTNVAKAYIGRQLKENANVVWTELITEGNVSKYISGGGGVNSCLGIKVYVSSATYTPNPKATTLKVTLIGAGTSGYYLRGSGSITGSGRGVDGDCLISVIDNPAEDVSIIIGAAEGYTTNNGDTRKGGATSFGSIISTNAIEAGRWPSDPQDPKIRNITTNAIKSGTVLFHSNSPLFDVAENKFVPIYTASYGVAGAGTTNASNGILIVEEYA